MGNFKIIQTEDQWLRCAFSRPDSAATSSTEGTAFIGGVVQLHDLGEYQTESELHLPRAPGGLAFDASCRLYHSVPDEGRVERVRWAGTDPLNPTLAKPEPVELFAPVAAAEVGDFTLTVKQRGVLDQPVALAITHDQRLFIADAGLSAIFVLDLWTRRLLRRVDAGEAPLDLTTNGELVFVLLSRALLKLDARSSPTRIELPAEVSHPSRLTIAPDGALYVLERGGTQEARVVPVFIKPTAATGGPTTKAGTPVYTQWGGDVEILPGRGFDSSSDKFLLIVSLPPGEDFLCIEISSKGASRHPGLKAKGYDGRGIVRTPDGRIGFWTAKGLRHAVSARARYTRHGRVVSYRLDSGEFQMVWGRVYLDACIPEGTEVKIRCLTSDEPPEVDLLARTAPANVVDSAAMEITALEQSPMPPRSWVGNLAADRPLYRRENGRELPWVQIDPGDSFMTYEAPVESPPGRYLWVMLELSGNGSSTPRIRSLRAEYPSHEYLRRLPQLFSRDDLVASFLRRYLAIFEGALTDWEIKAATRHVLIDPRSAPEELLPWLAGFVGLVLDERFPAAVRRTLIREAVRLFRFRGTIPGLTRFLEIYTGVKVMLLERFKLRGSGGAIVGGASQPTANSVLGAGFRVGGAIGEPENQSAERAGEQSFENYAHRFSVVIPAILTPEQIEVATNILEVHRPAHTLFDICTVEAGMRVGMGLHVALTSVIGASGGFEPVQLGQSLLGRRAVIGRAEPGSRVGASRLGNDSRVG